MSQRFVTAVIAAGMAVGALTAIIRKTFGLPDWAGAGVFVVSCLMNCDYKNIVAHKGSLRFSLRSR